MSKVGRDWYLKDSNEAAAYNALPGQQSFRLANTEESGHLDSLNVYVVCT